ncbi:MAG: hypothetical protein MUC88_17170 [Planctomycetes bacterium]|nr:hypothetical protein [Planctomycetota bacterium]
MIPAKEVLVVLVTLYVCSCGCAPQRLAPAQPVNQCPSPMTDAIRAHQRVENKALPDAAFVLKGTLSKPVEVHCADPGQKQRCLDLLVHFHGAGYVARRAGLESGRSFIVAVVNLGSGSAVYENELRDAATFPRLVETIRTTISERMAAEIQVSGVYVSSFSAGYGAVRAILKHHPSMVDGLVLLDGLHTDYVPSGRVLSQGGVLNTDKLQGFLEYARLAVEGKKRFLITHSEIFPGTYASTTETADYLIDALHLRRHAVLKWGPGGMQMLSETQRHGLTILGFAGNTAPDHMDHLHGLPVFLKMILDAEERFARRRPAGNSD